MQKREYFYSGKQEGKNETLCLCRGTVGSEGMKHLARGIIQNYLLGGDLERFEILSGIFNPDTNFEETEPLYIAACINQNLSVCNVPFGNHDFALKNEEIVKKALNWGLISDKDKDTVEKILEDHDRGVHERLMRPVLEELKSKKGAE